MDTLPPDSIKKENYFDIENPESWNCRVWVYKSNPGVLQFRVYQDWKTHFWLTFESVVYYKGLLIWRNAGFNLASSEVAMKLFHSLPPEAISGMPAGHYSEDALRLFTVVVDPNSSPLHEVEILISGSAKLLHEPVISYLDHT